jgi:hypothetical protein
METMIMMVPLGVRGRQSGRSVVALLFVVTVAGCGGNSGGNVAPDAGEESQPASSSGGSAGDGTSESEPQALGIDAVQWPGDQDGAQAVLDRMPDELGGMEVERPESMGPYTGVMYGSGDSGVLVTVVGPDGDMQDPVDTLAAIFGLGAICLEGTYAGTAAPSEWGGGPDVNRNGVGPEDGLWWFSCDFEADGTPPVTGHAIGWVSGDLAWLVTTPDQDTTSLTVAALSDAVG